jgi:hypothetical protein
VGQCVFDSFESEKGVVTDPCEHGREISCSIKGVGSRATFNF